MIGVPAGSGVNVGRGVGLMALRVGAIDVSVWRNGTLNVAIASGVSLADRPCSDMTVSVISSVEVVVISPLTGLPMLPTASQPRPTAVSSSKASKIIRVCHNRRISRLLEIAFCVGYTNEAAKRLWLVLQAQEISNKADRFAGDVLKLPPLVIPDGAGARR